MTNLKSIILKAGYLDGDDLLTEMKGHRSDVLVETKDGAVYELNFINLDRLKIELESNASNGVNCFTDRGLIILEKISKDDIVAAVGYLEEQKYFDSLKPIVVDKEDSWYYINLK